MPDQNAEKFRRCLEILRLIPGWPDKISTTELHERLGSDRDKVTTRNDLRTVCELFMIETDKDEPGMNGRKAHWWWPQDAPTKMFPALDRDAAMVLTLLSRFGGDLLPPGFPESMRRIFQVAEDELGRARNATGWVDRVVVNRPVVRQAIPRSRPAIDPEIRNNIYRAVAEQRALDIVYGSRHLRDLGVGAAIEGLVYPIGLDVQPNKITLIGQFQDRADRPGKYGEAFVQFVLHRFDRADLVESHRVPSRITTEFTMAEYAERHESDLPRPSGEPGDGRQIELVARVSAAMKRDFEDYPVGEGQEIQTTAEGVTRIRTRIRWNQNLEMWLLSMVPDLMVEAPEELRDWMTQQLETGLMLYRDSGRS